MYGAGARPLRAARVLQRDRRAALADKLVAALAAGLQPILCVGETQAEREGDETEAKLRAQLTEGLAKLSDEQLGEVVIAYEPIWAIGTGLTASPEQAQEACALIRARRRRAFRRAGRARACALRRLDEA